MILAANEGFPHSPQVIIEGSEQALAESFVPVLNKHGLFERRHASEPRHDSRPHSTSVRLALY